jgi:stage IV sporulation protein B
MDDLMCAVSNSREVKPGKAYIYSTVSGVSPQKYEIEIVKVDKLNRENKNYVIKVTDGALIAETGGIVQGMSGSPILQGGRLVGAVTHVFLNDPTRGYGIDIERMIRE